MSLMSWLAAASRSDARQCSEVLLLALLLLLAAPELVGTQLCGCASGDSSSALRRA
jgi:hypothetical protein